ncbi:MAG: ABC transporter permease [Patescibacteria group bacterium]|nr:ABC transporter permease [Patescibacteria group bacterium]
MLQFLNPVKISYRNLMASKLRSLLTIVGIVIGVAAVIIIFAVGKSAQKLIVDQIQGVGSNLIAVMPGAAEDDGPPATIMGISITTLTYSDLKAIINSTGIPEIEAGAGYVDGTVGISQKDVNLNASLTGTTASYMDVENAALLSGRFFNIDEEKNLSRVVVLGNSIARDLFEKDDPVGGKIKIKDQNFTVIGVLEERSSGGFGVADQDGAVFIPLKTAQKLILGIEHLGYIRLKISNSEMSELVEAEVASILRQEHNIQDIANDDFTIRDQATTVETLNQITDVLRYFLLAVGSISLLVGGIGIMNIMLIVINQRMREIGLRKAIGARDTDIIIQFLIETVTISSIGGIVGIFTGVVVSFLVSMVAGAMGYTWSFIISPFSIITAVLISVAIGVIFGIYPAKKAAKISPMESLRYE